MKRLMIIVPVISAAGFAMASTADAVTVNNSDSKEHTIGIDWGNKESVEKIAGGKSVQFKCPDGCGVTGPWGFSWMAQGDDTASTDGKSINLGSKS